MKKKINAMLNLGGYFESNFLFFFKYALPAYSYSNDLSYVPCSVTQSCLTLCDSSLSMEFSRQKYWSELPCPPQRIFPIQGLNPGLLHCSRILYHQSHLGSPSSVIEKG